MSITNLQLGVLMSAYCQNGSYDMHHNGPNQYVQEGVTNETYQRQCCELLNEGLIEASPSRYKYRCTDKGRFYLNAILATPFPIEKTIYEIPR